MTEEISKDIQLAREILSIDIVGATPQDAIEVAKMLQRERHFETFMEAVKNGD